MRGISIGMNGSMLDNQPTGTGVYSFNLINNLSRLYWEENWLRLTVFSPTSSLLNKDLRIVKLSRLLLSSEYGRLAALTRFVWNTFYYPFQARHFDLLISPTTHGSFILKNQIITIHDLISLRFRNISAHQRFYFKFLLPFLASRSKLIIAVSETTKKDIIRFLNCPPEKIKVIYNGYDHIHYCPSGEPDQLIHQNYGIKDYILAIGPTYPHKNFITLLDAYNGLDPRTKQKYPLVIAGGKKPYITALKQYVKTIKLGETVHFLGYVPIHLMPSLYREAFTLIFPSLYEGFGIPLLEAMACGCPVISSDTSSMPEVCGNAALYIDPLDRAAMTAAMEQLIVDKKLRQSLIEKGIIRAKEFSWAQTAKSLKKVIDKQFSLTHKA